MQLTTVSSSAISAAGYEPSSRRKKITFVQGYIYDFCGVPQQIFNGLMSAGSKGGYYNNYIKDRYQC